MYTMRQLQMIRPRGGISSAYAIILDGKVVKVFGRKSAAEKFMREVGR